MWLLDLACIGAALRFGDFRHQALSGSKVHYYSRAWVPLWFFRTRPWLGRVGQGSLRTPRRPGQVPERSFAVVIPPVWKHQLAP